jgi:hypothetical protein
MDGQRREIEGSYIAVAACGGACLAVGGGWPLILLLFFCWEAKSKADRHHSQLCRLCAATAAEKTAWLRNFVASRETSFESCRAHKRLGN